MNFTEILFFGGGALGGSVNIWSPSGTGHGVHSEGKREGEDMKKMRNVVKR